MNNNKKNVRFNRATSIMVINNSERDHFFLLHQIYFKI